MSSHSLASLLKTFPHTRFHREARLLTWRPRGLFDDAFADEIVGFIESEALDATEPFNRYTDFGGLTKIKLSIGHVFQIAQRRREASEPVKSAFCAETIVGFGIAHLYEELMKDACIQVRAFRERQAAADWLGVPVEMLRFE